MTGGLRLSVVICTKDRPVELRRCLDSLAIQSRLPEELIVVDASATPAREVVADFASVAAERCAVQLIPAEPGLPRQRNIGARAATGEVVVYLDDDVVLEEEYLAAIEEVYLRDPDGRIGGVGGAQVPDPTPRLSYLRRIWDKLFLLETYGSGRVKASGAPSYLFTPMGQTDVEFLSGCNMSFRRSVLERFAFDERRKGYAHGEDLEFSFRVSRHFRLVLTPGARLDHRHAPNGRPSLRLGTEQALFNRFLFARDHVVKSPLGWAVFLWAEIGRFGLGLRRGAVDTVIGTVRGCRAVLSEVRRGRATRQPQLAGASR